MQESARTIAGQAGGQAGKTARPRPVSDSLDPILPKDFGVDEARHLLWRAGFGGTPAQLKLLVEWGPEKSVDHLVKYDSVPGEDVKADTFDKDIMRPLSQEERQTQRRAAAGRDEETLAQMRTMRQEAERKDREQVRAVQRWWLKRMIETGRPLEEKMTLFWHSLLATSYRTIEDSYHMFVQNQLFRSHATGNYGELLHALIRDPAMLAYLDNNDSRKGRPNENLARELMELFSLGVGNYSEEDIKEGARALTGYTFQDDQFQFQRNNHDTGNKTILGRSGSLDGDAFVDAILEKRECAQYIARRLYRFFVSDYPSGRPEVDAAGKTVIRELGNTLARSRYNLRPALRKMFLSRHFYDPALRGEQIKSPVQLVVGAIRSLGAPARDLATLVDAMNMMGQHILFPPSVKGWDGGRSWINTSTMFVRQNTMVYLLTGKRPQGRDGLADQEPFDGSSIMSQLSAAYPESGASEGDKQLGALLLFTTGRVEVTGRATLEELLRSRGGRLDGKTASDGILLISAMPEYQLC